MNYQNKYFKYKSKYLSLKYGGATTVDRNARNSSDVKDVKTKSYFSIPILNKKKEEYVQIEEGKEAERIAAHKQGQKYLKEFEKNKATEEKKRLKTDKEIKAIEETRLNNRTKLLNKLKKILNNIPYDEKLVNCKLNSCTCKKCKVGENNINTKQDENKYCKNEIFKDCECIDGNANLEKRPTIISLPTMTSWTSMETFCPNEYKHTKDIASIIESEINKSKYNIYFDSNKISKENIRILLTIPIDDAANKNFINSEKKDELIEYIITKLKNKIGSIYV